MKAGSILRLGVLSLLSGLLGSCASHGPGPANADPATQKQGHWVTVPPETGSLIPRRVWVEDSSQTNATPSINNVQNGSAAGLPRMQNSPHSFRPPGS